MISRLVKKCATCRGRGFTSGLTEDSEWTCPDCEGTGEECGHATPKVVASLAPASDLDAAAASTPAPVQCSEFNVECSMLAPVPSTFPTHDHTH